jgi:hypothetical protein
LRKAEFLHDAISNCNPRIDDNDTGDAPRIRLTMPRLSRPIVHRAAALRSVADSNSIFQKQYNPAFVLMEYYGYLRRNPDDAPDNNFSGYDFWLNKLNQFSLPGEDVRNESVALGRVKRAEMVRAFLVAGEYRQRFAGSPTGNQQASQEPSPGAKRWQQEFGSVLQQVAMQVLSLVTSFG